MLTDKTLTEFNGILASSAPAPGGGSVAALSGSLAASLAAMVGGLTAGRAKYAEFERETAELIKNASELSSELMILVDADTKAYDNVSAVLSMPKETPEQKKARSAAMQDALKEATLVPLKTMERSVEVLRLSSQSLGKTNASAVSDLGISALCGLAALRGGWLNVKINLSGIKDEAFTSEIRAKAACLLSEGEQLAEGTYAKVESEI